MTYTPNPPPSGTPGGGVPRGYIVAALVALVVLLALVAMPGGQTPTTDPTAITQDEKVTPNTAPPVRVE